MTVETWLAWACEDARRRGLEALVPLLEGLAPATRALRAADWNDAADGPAPHDTTPASPGSVTMAPPGRDRSRS